MKVSKTFCLNCYVKGIDMDDALLSFIVFAKPFVSTVAEMAIQGDLFCTLPIFHRTLRARAGQLS